jgi:hypothetical protein
MVPQQLSGNFAMTILEIGSQQPKRRSKSNGDARAVLVSAVQMAKHLGCVRSYLDKLLEQGVLERRDDGKFELDVNRLRYIRHLKEARKVSPRSEADTEFQKAKTELIRIRILEKQRVLIPLEEAVDHMEKAVGLFLTFASGLAARVAGSDLSMRRKIEQAVYEMRLGITKEAERLADEAGEPPEQDASDAG